MSLSLANLGGRVVWAGLSDHVGRRRMFMAYTLLSAPLYYYLPHWVDSISHNPDPTYLTMFYASTLGIFSFYGAAYSTAPAFAADLFGTKTIGAIVGRLLTVSTVGAIVGPNALAFLRRREEVSAISDLAAKVMRDGGERDGGERERVEGA